MLAVRRRPDDCSYLLLLGTAGRATSWQVSESKWAYRGERASRIQEREPQLVREAEIAIARFVGPAARSPDVGA